MVMISSGEGASYHAVIYTAYLLLLYYPHLIYFTISHLNPVAAILFLDLQ
jgi:hypothetical protein